MLLPHLLRRIGDSASPRRRTLLAVPLVLLLAFAGSAWLGLLAPLPGALSAGRVRPPFLGGSVSGGTPTKGDVQGDAQNTAQSNPPGDLASIVHTLPPEYTAVPGPDPDGRLSPFSFDVDRAVAGANASAYARWMAAAPDALPLAALSLPGSHDTMTHRVALAGFRCQNAPLALQLAAGLRYLDIRARVQVPERSGGASGGASGRAAEAEAEIEATVSPSETPETPETASLGIYHSIIYTGYDLVAVARTVFAFLDDNPSEMVVLRLKEEGPPIVGAADDPPGPRPDYAPLPPPPDGAPSPFVAAWEAYLRDDPRTAPGFAKHLYRHDPASAAPLTVGALRGKILLLQEFPYFPADRSFEAAPPGSSVPGAVARYGIPWALASPQLRVEDLWRMRGLADLDAKWSAVRDNLRAAAHSALDAPAADRPLFLSHLSASVGVTPIDAAAGPRDHSVVGINDRTGAWLERGDDDADTADAAVTSESQDAVAAAGGERRQTDTATDTDTATLTPVGIVMADFPGRRLVDAILRRNSFVHFD